METGKESLGSAEQKLKAVLTLVLVEEMAFLSGRNVTSEDLKRQRQSLPIYSARNSLIREVRQNRCCVVVGETGSGKTTQIPQVHRPVAVFHLPGIIEMALSIV